MRCSHPVHVTETVVFLDWLAVCPPMRCHQVLLQYLIRMSSASSQVKDLHSIWVSHCVCTAVWPALLGELQMGFHDAAFTTSLASSYTTFLNDGELRPWDYHVSSSCGWDDQWYAPCKMLSLEKILFCVS